MKNKRILFVYENLHPVHEKYMRSIGADFCSLKSKIPKDYDVYIFEATYIKPSFYRMIGLIGKDKKIISIIADPRLYYLDNKLVFSKNRILPSSFLRRFISLFLLKKIDGAICVGKTTQDLFKKFNSKAPSIYVSAPFSEKTKKEIGKVDVDLKNLEILFIGYGPDYYCKGLDLLIDSFKELKVKYPQLKLHILGDFWKVTNEWKIGGVFFHGRQNIIPFLKKCSIGVHLGRGEAFGTNIPEMMYAGIPVITSKFTGANEVVKLADESFIIPLDSKALSKKLVEFFEMPFVEKKILSNKCKKVSKNYSEDIQIKIFKRKFKELLSVV
jgi:glycosyltransferase involved in cell wall biosynthesis